MYFGTVKDYELLLELCPFFFPSNVVYFATSGGAVCSHQGLKRAFVWPWTPGQSYLSALALSSYSLYLPLYPSPFYLSIPSFFIHLSFSACVLSPFSVLLSFIKCQSFFFFLKWFWQNHGVIKFQSSFLTFTTWASNVKIYLVHLPKHKKNGPLEAFWFIYWILSFTLLFLP